MDREIEKLGSVFPEPSLVGEEDLSMLVLYADDSPLEFIKRRNRAKGEIIAFAKTVNRKRYMILVDRDVPGFYVYGYSNRNPKRPMTSAEISEMISILNAELDADQKRECVSYLKDIKYRAQELIEDSEVKIIHQQDADLSDFAPQA